MKQLKVIKSFHKDCRCVVRAYWQVGEIVNEVDMVSSIIMILQDWILKKVADSDKKE